MNRREFVKNSSLLGLGAVLMPDIEVFRKNKAIGIQLWSVREDMKKDANGTLAALSKAGFKFVEGFGLEEGKWFGHDTTTFKKMLADNGLSMPSAHFGLKSSDYDSATKTLSDPWKKAIEAAHTLNQHYIISPWTIDEDRKDKDALKKLADSMNHAGEICQKEGMRFGYHNHWFEFEKVGDQLMYTTLLQNTDPKLVAFEMDLCWATYSQQKPAEWFAKYAHRFELVHVKDVMAGTEKTTAIVGDGIVDFKNVIANAKLAGIKHYIIELENYKTTAVQDVETSLNRFKKMI